jgi:hypothetical protein
MAWIDAPAVLMWIEADNEHEFCAFEVHVPPKNTEKIHKILPQRANNG